MSKKTKVTLTISGCEAELPVLDAAPGHNIVDIQSLTKSIGLFAFDPGFMSTANCESKVTYIDDDEGLLYYRDYPIEQPTEKSDYLKVCYLLIYGRLSAPKQRAEFEYTVHHHTMVHEQPTWFFRGFCRDTHPVAMMVSVIGALPAFYQDSLDITNPERHKTVIYRLISKVPTVTAMRCHYPSGLSLNYPRSNLFYPGSFMYMMFATPYEDYRPNPILVRALDRIFVLHVDHEQGAPTSTMRLTGSSDANSFVCISAGIACLWGAPHSGADKTVLLILDEIGDVSYVVEYVGGIKQRKYHLMGFGRRVYRNVNPRANTVHQTCYEVLKKLNLEGSPKFKLAIGLERVAPKGPFFVERKPYPNVGFYSGVVLFALGIPTSMFTMIFALACGVGQISH